MSTILVTGGAGFIGSAVIRYLINHTENKVVNLDKLTYAANLDAVASVANSSRYYFEKADICDRESLDHIFQTHQPDAVMHLAAESHVDRSINGPAAFIETNIVGTYTLLEATRAYWEQLDGKRQTNFRFHQVSTDEVYGDLPHPNDPNNSAVTSPSASTPSSSASKLSSCAKSQDLPKFAEKSPYKPSSPYSASKASADHLVRAWHRTYGLPTLITNCSNNYGPWQHNEKLIPNTISCALQGKPIPVYGKGDQIRDWLYVEDHAEALCKVIAKGKVGETYNIGGNNEKTNLEVVLAICDLLDELAPISVVDNKPSPSTRYPMPSGAPSPSPRASTSSSGASTSSSCTSTSSPGASTSSSCAKSQDLQNHTATPSYHHRITHVTDRLGHDRRYAIDARKISDTLRWETKNTFEDNLKTTVQWFVSRM